MLYRYGIWCDVCKYVCYVGETGGCLYAGHSRTNHQGMGITPSLISLKIGVQGLSSALISIFELLKTSLYGISRQRLPKIKLKVKHHYVHVFHFSAQSRVLITVRQYILENSGDKGKDVI